MNFNQEYQYQNLNGLTDWFESAVDYTSDVVSDAAFRLTEATGTTEDVLAMTEKLDEKASQISSSARAKIEKFQKAVARLLNTQDKVDEAIESLPEGPDKQRLEAKRSKSRGIFQNYVLPAYQQVRNYLGMDDNSANYSGSLGFGAIPIVGIAAVLGAVSVAMTYIYSAQSIEEQILKDPALAKTYVASRGSLFSLGPLPGYVALGLLGVGGVYLYSRYGKGGV